MRRCAALAGSAARPIWRIMTDAAAKSPKGPVQIHAPLQAWFEAKAAEPAPEHLVALADELEAFAGAGAVRKAS